MSIEKIKWMIHIKNLMMGGFAYVKNYGLRFLFQTTFGTSKTNLVNNIQLSKMNSSSVQKQLKAAGIDTNSKKYKAALSEMMKNGNGAMFTNVQAIKNLMSQYDKNGDWIDPNTGLTGLAVTDENRNSYKHIISIPESSQEEMFELAKKEFLNENGTLNGDTTKRESVYNNLYRKMDKDDRLSAGWTMEQYEHQYRQALQKQQKPLILHGKLENQYRLVHWMALPESLLRVARNQ